VVSVVCRWLGTASGNRKVPGGEAVYRQYLLWKVELPSYFATVHKTPEEVAFKDYLAGLLDWLSLNNL